jgi:hypothetical protein
MSQSRSALPSEKLVTMVASIRAATRRSTCHGFAP